MREGLRSQFFGIMAGSADGSERAAGHPTGSGYVFM